MVKLGFSVLKLGKLQPGGDRETFTKNDRMKEALTVMDPKDT